MTESSESYEEEVKMEEGEEQLGMTDAPLLPEAKFVLLLSQIDEGKPTTEAFSFILDMILAAALGAYGNGDELDFYQITFGILDQCEESVQLENVSRLHSLAVQYTRVRAYCAKWKWGLRLLKKLPSMDGASDVTKELVNLIQILASFHIGVEELRLTLRLMRAQTHDRRPSIWPTLLDVLQRIATQPSGPRCYFDFSGTHSGLLIPAFPKFPSGGYTFIAQMRIESFTHPHLPQGTQYYPRLYCLTGSRGDGAEVFFLGNFLTVQTTETNGKQYVVKFTYPFRANQWYHIAISHEYHFLTKSQVSLYVDGHLKLTLPCAYPKTDGALTQSSIAVALKNQRPCHHLIGQLGCVYICEGVVSGESILEMHRLGPTASEASRHQRQLMLNPKTKNIIKLLLSYNPQAVDGALCLETSRGGKTLNATKMEGVDEVTQSDLREAFVSVGGPLTLFPLISQLDLPLLSTSGFDEPDSPDSSDYFTVNPEQAGAVCELLGTALQHQLNREAMKSQFGFHLFGFLVERISPLSWTPEVVNVLERLVSGISSAAEDIMRHFFINVYLNFQIWVYTPVEVQRLVIQTVANHAGRNPAYFRSLITVQRIMDILRSYYWFSADRDSRGQNSVRHAATQEVLASRPNTAGVRRVRDSLLHLIRVIAPQHLTLDETRSIVAYLLLAPDTEHEGVDVLQLLLAYMNLNGSLSRHLVALGGLSTFIALLKRNSIMYRVWSLKIMGRLLETADAMEKAKMLSQNPFRLIKHYLSAYPLNKPTYFVLLELLLESVDTVNVANPVHPTMEQSFKNPGVLVTIFELLCLTPRRHVQERTLQDFMHILNQSAANRNAFLSQAGWQAWLLAILATQKNSGTEGAAVRSLVTDIMAMLLHHSIYGRDGWQTIRTTNVLVQQFGEVGLLDAAQLERRLNFVSLRSLSRDSMMLQQAKSSKVIYENLVCWVGVTEHTLFTIKRDASADHSLLSIHRNASGMWEDFRFSQTFLAFLDKLLRVAVERKAAGVALGAGDSSGSGALPIGTDAEAAILRPILRLTLHTVYEADMFLDTKRVEERKTTLSEIEAIILGGCDTVGTSVQSALSAYKRDKMDEWSHEVESVRSTYTESLKRLQVLAKRIVAVEGPKATATLLHVSHTLFKAMKKSYERKGVGAELMLEVFKDILALLQRQPKGLPQNLRQMPLDQLVNYLMQWYSFGKDTFEGVDEIEEALDAKRDEEQSYAATAYERMEDAKAVERGLMENKAAQEAQEVSRFEQAAGAGSLAELWNHETARRTSVARSVRQKRVLLSKKWRQLLTQLSSERGPWADLSEEQHSSKWMLDPTETRTLRMRVLRKRNAGFDAHHEASKKRGDESDYEREDAGEPRRLDGLGQFILSEPMTAEDAAEEAQEVASPSPSKGPPAAKGKAQRLSQVKCELMQGLGSIRGHLDVNSDAIVFSSTKADGGVEKIGGVEASYSKTKRWEISQLTDVQSRRHLLKQNSLELFFAAGRTYMIVFPDAADYLRVYKVILAARPPRLSQLFHGGMFRTAPPRPGSLIRKKRLIERWRTREISNFEYLMELNTLAGRTYNDLSQYPVFPWVLKDYTSASLNLHDPKIYRDLSKPVGALNNERLEGLVERFNSMHDMNDEPPFLYGSHYSSAAIVLYFMLRMEPFTTTFLKFQGGRWDHVERMFTSISQTWDNALHHSTDFKELIPELFYDPDILRNTNGFNFGRDQQGNGMSDVELPPWAPTPEAFVRIHREALESDYVSANLHRWIDLIFGYQQRGEAAVRAHNVFYYLTYQGMIDLDAIEDSKLRDSVEAQIENFGQTPTQLFSQPHPPRVAAPVSQSGKPSGFALRTKLSEPMVYVGCASPDLIVTVYSGGSFGVSRLIPSQTADASAPFRFEEDRTLATPKAKRLKGSLVGASQFMAVSDNGEFFVTAKHWDQSFRIFNIKDGKVAHTASDSLGIITCLSLGNDGTLVTGSKDATVLIWDIASVLQTEGGFFSSKRESASLKPRFRGTGHDARVTCIALSTELSVVVSGSEDGTCIVMKLAGARFISSLSCGSVVRRVAVTSNAYVVAHTEDKQLMLFSVTGKHLTTVPNVPLLEDMLPLVDGRSIITAEGNAVCIRSCEEDLKLKHRFECDASILSVAVSPFDSLQYILASTSSGKLNIFPMP